MRKKLIAASLCLAMLLTLFSACQIISVPYDFITIVSNAVKYKREERVPRNGVDTLTAQLARNEYEGMQFVLNFDHDVKDVKVYISELKDEKGNKIPTENITIYREEYAFTKSSTTFYDSRKGWFPDTLVPINTYEDLNSTPVKKGENQAFWISVKAESDQPAGIYRGNVTVKIDGKDETVPVEVEVWDITIPEKSSMPTLYYSYYGSTYNFIKKANPENTLELEAFREDVMNFFFDYRITTVDTAKGGLKTDITKNPVGWADELAAFFEANPRLTCYCMGLWGERISLSNVAQNGTPSWLIEATDRLRELGILDKVYTFMRDEPRYVPECVPELQKGLEALSKDIPDLKNLVTNPPCTSLDGYIDAWCPVWGDCPEFAIQNRRDKGEEFWEYGCFAPQYPSPTYHIPDDLMTSRLIRWMMKDWNVDGDLYWSCLETTQKKEETVLSPGDGYIAIVAFEGDGVINHNILLPTLRLESARDGFEDYELLLLLEENVKKKMEEWNITEFSLDQLMDTYYTPLFFDCFSEYDHDPALMLEMRKRVAHDILHPETVVATYAKVTKENRNQRGITVYAESGSEVMVDGKKVEEKVCGNHSEYTVYFDMNKVPDYTDVKVTVNGEEYVRTLRPVTDEITSFELPRTKIASDLKTLGLDGHLLPDIVERYAYNMRIYDNRTLPEGQKTLSGAEGAALLEDMLVQDLNNKIPLIVTNEPNMNASQQELLKIYVPKGAEVKVNGMAPTLLKSESTYDYYTYNLDCTGFGKYIYEISVTHKGVTEVSKRAIETTIIKNVLDFNDPEALAIIEKVNTGRRGGSCKVVGNAIEMTFDLSEEHDTVTIVKDAMLPAFSEFKDCQTVYLKVTNMGEESIEGVSCVVGSVRDEASSNPSNRINAGETLEHTFKIFNPTPHILRAPSKIQIKANGDSGIVKLRLEGLSLVNQVVSSRYI